MPEEVDEGKPPAAGPVADGAATATAAGVASAGKLSKNTPQMTPGSKAAAAVPMHGKPSAGNGAPQQANGTGLQEAKHRKEKKAKHKQAAA